MSYPVSTGPVATYWSTAITEQGARNTRNVRNVRHNFTWCPKSCENSHSGMIPCISNVFLCASVECNQYHVNLTNPEGYSVYWDYVYFLKIILCLFIFHKKLTQVIFLSFICWTSSSKIETYFDLTSLNFFNWSI